MLQFTIEQAPAAPAATHAGYHECWYPVGLSADLARGDVIGLDLCGGRIVVYRDDQGTAHALTARCKHMGADLTLGDVLGSDLRCPFHHWRYGADGWCTLVPSGDRIPPGARLATFPLRELWGLIWIFLGHEPTYELPEAPLVDDLAPYSFEVEFQRPLRVDPWVFMTNVFDFQHLRTVHGLKIETDPDHFEIQEHSISYDLAYDDEQGTPSSVKLSLWGTNCLVTLGSRDGVRSIHLGAGTPMGEHGSRFFVSVLMPMNASQEERDRVRALHNGLLNEDLPILNTMTAGPSMLVHADRAVVRYLRYADRYPRASIDQFDQPESRADLA